MWNQKRSPKRSDIFNFWSEARGRLATSRIASTKEYAKFFAKNFAQRLFAVARASLFCETILCVAISYVALRKKADLFNLWSEARLVYHQFRGREVGGKPKKQTKNNLHFMKVVFLF